MEKKRTTIWIHPLVLKKLKLMGIHRDQPIGNVIEALVKFTDMVNYVNDEDFKRHWNAMLDTAFLNAGHRAGWKEEGEVMPNRIVEGGKGQNGNDLED